MNKKKLLLVAATSMIAVVGLTFAINSSGKEQEIFGSGPDRWHHYAAVAATEDSHGSKEFWSNESDGCATHTFVNPGVVCIEHDFSEYPSFATLTSDDDRYVAPIPSYSVSYEVFDMNKMDVYPFSNYFASSSVTPSKFSNGTLTITLNLNVAQYQIMAVYCSSPYQAGETVQNMGGGTYVITDLPNSNVTIGINVGYYVYG